VNDRLAAVRRALAQAPAERLEESLAEELVKAYSITDVDLLLIDYRLAALVPLRGGPALTSPGHPAWRSFDHQTEVVDAAAQFLPITMRGDRLGVLRLAPAPADPVLRAELSEVATQLAHELAAVRMSTDRYLVAARTRRLTLAAEIQWELLPGRSRTGPGFGLAGQLEPAYAVRGDSFDWADDGERVWLSAVNGNGEGVAAAALTSLATHALRNARRAGLSLADQAALADQAVFAHHRGSRHLSVLLLQLELATGSVTAVDAGSPRMLLLRDGEVEGVSLEAQLPLGMFDGTLYAEQHFALSPGDRLFVVSDGVHAAAPGGRPAYGERGLAAAIRSTRLQPAAEAVGTVMRELHAYHEQTHLDDDAVIVCLDWRGMDGAPSG
jgi:serine phosphatase RsbU (regulator of sigma subunit)